MNQQTADSDAPVLSAKETERTITVNLPPIDHHGCWRRHPGGSREAVRAVSRGSVQMNYQRGIAVRIPA